MTGVDPLTPGDTEAEARPSGGRSRLRQLLGWALVVATLGFVALTIARHRTDLANVEWHIDVPLLLASIGVLLVAFGYGIWIWRRILQHLGVDVSFPAVLRIWFLASLARYMPGKIWQFVGAAQLGRAYGIAAVPLVTSMVLSMGFNMAAAIVLGLPFLAARFVGSDAAAAALSVIGILTTIALLHPRPINAMLALIPRTRHREVLSWRAGWGAGLLLLGGFLVSWLVYGTAFTLFAGAVFDTGLDLLPAFIAANCVSVLAGVLAVVAPAGLGAREFTLTVLLEPYLPTAGAAALLALASRLWVIAVEVVGAVLSVWIARVSRPVPRP